MLSPQAIWLAVAHKALWLPLYLRLPMSLAKQDMTGIALMDFLQQEVHKGITATSSNKAGWHHKPPSLYGTM
ncbi:MAG: hypothetical protein AAF215_01060 [Cyanobacteria bacterium P01_A01_bin.123]